MTTRKSRSQAEIEGRLETLDPTTPRYQILAAVRDFKSAWVEVGQKLTLVRENNSFRQWGYTSFEQYCQRELRIKNETANKLTRSFAFMRDHEPKALGERTQRDLPPLDVVDLLAQARERVKASPQDLRSINQEVFAADGQLTKPGVMRRFRELDPDAFRPVGRAEKNSDGLAEIRRALILAERLDATLKELPDMPVAVKRNSAAVVEELRRRFKTNRPQDD